MDEVDDADVGDAIQELASKKLTFSPLVTQDTPLGQWLYDQLGKSWVRWAVKLPASAHPIVDETGEFCGEGQSGLVWNLAGTFGNAVTRDCDVPFGKALFFPLLNTFATIPPDVVDETFDEAYWIAYASELIPAARTSMCELTLRYDGHEILSGTAERDARLWTEVLDPFPVFVHETDNIYGYYPGGVWDLGFNGGHYALFLPPLPGDHVLELGGKSCTDGVPTFEVSATYNLHVH